MFPQSTTLVKRACLIQHWHAERERADIACGGRCNTSCTQQVCKLASCMHCRQDDCWSDTRKRNVKQDLVLTAHDEATKLASPPTAVLYLWGIHPPTFIGFHLPRLQLQLRGSVCAAGLVRVKLLGSTSRIRSIEATHPLREEVLFCKGLGSFHVSLKARTGNITGSARIWSNFQFGRGWLVSGRQLQPQCPQICFWQTCASKKCRWCTAELGRENKNCAMRLREVGVKLLVDAHRRQRANRDEQVRDTIRF